jgi:XFP C-terminal domain
MRLAPRLGRMNQDKFVRYVDRELAVIESCLRYRPPLPRLLLPGHDVRPAECPRLFGHDNLHVRGYKEQGTTTTPFDMVRLNDLDRFYLVIDFIDRVLGLAATPVTSGS